MIVPPRFLPTPRGLCLGALAALTAVPARSMTSSASRSADRGRAPPARWNAGGTAPAGIGGALAESAPSRPARCCQPDRSSSRDQASPRSRVAASLASVTAAANDRGSSLPFQFASTLIASGSPSRPRTACTAPLRSTPWLLSGEACCRSAISCCNPAAYRLILARSRTISSIRSPTAFKARPFRVHVTFIERVNIAAALPGIGRRKNVIVPKDYGLRAWIRYHLYCLFWPFLAHMIWPLREAWRSCRSASACSSSFDDAMAWHGPSRTGRARDRRAGDRCARRGLLETPKVAFGADDDVHSWASACV
jgi:hypothetical protein